MYICIERERERCVYIHVHTHIIYTSVYIAISEPDI